MAQNISRQVSSTLLILASSLIPAVARAQSGSSFNEPRAGTSQVMGFAGGGFGGARFAMADDSERTAGLAALAGLRVALQKSDVVLESDRLANPTGALGKDVRVTLNDGSTRQGKLEALSPSEVTVEGKPIPLADVRKIEKVGHATRKAVWIGLLAAVPTFLILGPAADMGKDMALTIVAAGVGGGIAVGAVIDAARKPGNVIYLAPGTSVSFTVRPILATDRQGVAFVTNW